jgi:hypothetical protein
MCTVSWIRDADGYQLLCNRDEKRTRMRAAAPALIEHKGVKLITPVDQPHGGSWLSVNEFGLTLCLLNGANLSGAAAPTASHDYRSRGLLLLELAPQEAALNACERAWHMDLSRYAPFTLAALEPGLPTMLFEWNGAERLVLLNGEPYMPLVSSSFDAAGVQTRRRALFSRHIAASPRPTAAQLFSFHSSHGACAGAYSPCMHRPDAETVSFSWVKVAARQAEFFYAPGAPCHWSPGQTHTLPLTQ